MIDEFPSFETDEGAYFDQDDPVWSSYDSSPDYYDFSPDDESMPYENRSRFYDYQENPGYSIESAYDRDDDDLDDDLDDKPLY